MLESTEAQGSLHASVELARGSSLNYIFCWDSTKSDRCYQERGFDFAYACRIFDDPAGYVQVDARFDYARLGIACWAEWKGECSSWFTPNEPTKFGLFLRAKRTSGRSANMKPMREDIAPISYEGRGRGRIDRIRVDATTEAEIAKQIVADDAEAMQDVAKYARRVRERLGMSQAAFSARIGVSMETIRNWEQGKRCPTGAAKALLRILDKAPEEALAALD